MSAAIRLDAIYERYALLHEKNEARAERAELRATAQRTQEGAFSAQESASEADGLSEDEQLSAVFGSILNGGRDKADAHAD